jgi:hypothetical protein
MALTDSLISYWKLDSDGTDSIGGNTLVFTNGTSVAGKLSNGESFTASTGYARDTTASGLPAGTGPVSYAFCIKATGWGAGFGNWVMQCVNSSNGNNYVMGIVCAAATNQVHIFIGDGSTSTNTAAQTTSALNNTTFTHYVFTRTGTAWEIYENGTSLSSGTFGSNLSATGLDTINIRCNSGPAAIPVEAYVMDEVGIWGKVLTSGEVTQLYNSGNGLTYPFTTTSASSAIFFGGGF